MAEASVLRGLLEGGWRDLSFEAFRDGIEIHRIETGETAENAQAAILRYAPGARVPMHQHTGAEMILVLEGEQCDTRGRYPAGTLIINHPDSRHVVTAPEGCVVLIIWSRPIAFVDAAPGDAG
ncbi:MAG: cupin domain-containing protein [Burkholderiaceae bacterium]